MLISQSKIVDMKRLILLSLLVGFLGFQSCSDKDDKILVPENLLLKNFVWQGLHQYYLWQNEVTDLRDDRFGDQDQVNAFLATKDSPETLFQDLLNKPVSKYPLPGEAVDRFSVMVSDYTVLENLFAGKSTTNGVDFGLKYKTGSTTELFGWVRYVLSNSDGNSKGVKRGDIFYAIDGIPLTVSNYKTLLSQTTATYNMADYAAGNIVPNNKSVTLVKSADVYENPVAFSQIIIIQGKTTGYLMYNAFIPSNESLLNEIFNQFKAANITNLILDLRYNSGGSVDTARRLASMITGQFNNQVFAKQIWNSKLQPQFESSNPAALNILFTDKLANNVAINSINMSKLYVITSKSTASASELIINGLKPYIDVIQIGDTTTGKNTASITLYDSPDFSATDRSTKHKYAMQPLVLKLQNSAGFSDYATGLVPTTVALEDLGNLDALGTVTEPLLKLALFQISLAGKAPIFDGKKFNDFSDSKNLTPFGTELHLDQVPAEFYSTFRKNN